MRIGYKRQKSIKRVIVYVIFILYAVFSLVPMYWILSTSFKPPEEAISIPPTIFPKEISLENYRFVLTDPSIRQGLINSIMVSIPTMLVSVALSVLAGFSFARYEFKGKSVIMSVMMGLFMIPIVMNIVPLYLMFSRLGLLNTYVGLILAYQMLILPLNVFLLKSYFETIPKELEEAAMIDGCSRLGAFFRVTLPLSWPGIAVASVFSFRFAWNEFLLPLILTTDPDMAVYQLGIYNLMALEEIRARGWGILSSIISIGMLPMIIMLLIFQEKIIKGLTVGAVKK